MRFLIVMVQSTDDANKASCASELKRSERSFTKELGLPSINGTTGCVNWDHGTASAGLCCGDGKTGSALILTYERNDIAFDPAKHPAFK